MSQPPPPPNQPPSGGFGAPQEPSYGHPQQPGRPPQDPAQNPPAQPDRPGNPEQPVQLGKSEQQPPPNQPPSGGFGAPQEPSYGYPQQPGQPGQPPQGPPPPPSYGYPQHPGQPPPPPSYGYPQQPGYGQYGPYGQHPTYPMPGDGMQQPGGGGKKTKVLAIVAAVVAVLLVAGGSVWFLTRDDGGTEAGGDTKDTSEGGTDGGAEEDGTGGSGKQREHKDHVKVAWQLDAPKLPDSGERSYQVPGTWLVGDNIIRASVDSVTAYDMDSGEKAWSIAMVRGARCTSAPDMSQNRTLVQWGRKCEKVMAVDLARGKELWRKDLPSKDRGAREYDYTEMAVSGNTAAAAWIGDAVGYDLTTGKQMWSMEQGSQCADRGYVGGEQLIAKIECGYGSSEALQSVKADGAKGWQWKAPEGVKIRRIFSTDPVVIGVVAGGGFDVTDIMVINDKGKLQTKISIPKERYSFNCTGIALADCYNVVVDKQNDALYLQTEMHRGEGEYGRTNEIAAFDLSSGKSKWLSKPTEERQTSPLTMEDGKLLGYEAPTYDKAGLITVIDPRTGKTAPYVKMPEANRDAERGMNFLGDGRQYWYEGRFFQVVHRFSQDASLNKGEILAYN
ncbi:MAG TPA: PQQ-binding-like beta-propeller repeat protein [Streptomyces sp.]|nr:PQQ-binding-like beta-propeller repeat protein [Streptomyces sp.]